MEANKPIATNIYDKTSFQISEQITKNYSTSFYSATRFFDRETQLAIFGIYGFVRYADEIVDTFHDFDKARLLQKFEDDYYDAINQGISLNPVLQAFQLTVKKYNITDNYVQAFLQSMKNDLNKTQYENREEIENYIFGSADVVGLMCLKVFCNRDESLFQKLKKPAMKLGSAFQKVNFLRDIRFDTEDLGRNYFPDLTQSKLTDDIKKNIIEDIQNDFDEALVGINALPQNCKLAVTIAYCYYLELLAEIKKTPVERIMTERIRVSNYKKAYLIGKAFILNKLNHQTIPTEQVILVNDNDEEIGTMEKMEAHRKAQLHRAVSVFLFNKKGEWLLQQRAKEKYHSNRLWSNTCCTHPLPGETNIEAANRRLMEEMGMSCDLKKIFSFTYYEALDNELTEHELDHVFVGVTEDLPEINPSEVMDYKFINYAELRDEIDRNADKYTVWFRKIVEKVHEQSQQSN